MFSTLLNDITQLVATVFMTTKFCDLHLQLLITNFVIQKYYLQLCYVIIILLFTKPHFSLILAFLVNATYKIPNNFVN